MSPTTLNIIEKKQYITSWGLEYPSQNAVNILRLSRRIDQFLLSPL